MKSGPSTPAPDYRSMWKNYSSWRADDEALNTREMSRARASAAARGLRKGTPEWAKMESEMQAKADDRLSTLQSGTTYTSLQNAYQSYVAGQTKTVGGEANVDSGPDNRETVGSGPQIGYSQMPVQFGESGNVEHNQVRHITPGEMGSQFGESGNIVGGQRIEEGGQAQTVTGPIMSFDEWGASQYGDADPSSGVGVPGVGGTRQHAAGAEVAKMNPWLGKVAQGVK